MQFKFKEFQWNSILCYKGVQYYFTHERRARRSPECVKKYARVAYVILCNSVCKVQHNECTHGDEKPPPPIRDGRVYRGKARMYGGRSGFRGRSPRRGFGGGAVPHWLNNTFLFWRWNENTYKKIQKIHSKKKHARFNKDSWKII